MAVHQDKVFGSTYTTKDGAFGTLPPKPNTTDTNSPAKCPNCGQPMPNSTNTLTTR